MTSLKKEKVSQSSKSNNLANWQSRDTQSAIRNTDTSLYLLCFFCCLHNVHKRLRKSNTIQTRTSLGQKCLCLHLHLQGQWKIKIRQYLLLEFSNMRGHEGASWQGQRYAERRKTHRHLLMRVLSLLQNVHERLGQFKSIQTRTIIKCFWICKGNGR